MLSAIWLLILTNSPLCQRVFGGDAGSVASGELGLCQSSAPGHSGDLTARGRTYNSVGALELVARTAEHHRSLGRLGLK